MLVSFQPYYRIIQRLKLFGNFMEIKSHKAEDFDKTDGCLS